MPITAERPIIQKYRRLRRKMTPITITTNRLHLHNFRLWHSDDNQPPKVFADLLIGNGLLVSDIAFIPDPKSHYGFFQHWQWIRPRVNETHWKRSSPNATPPLGEFLGKAIFDWVFARKRNHAAMLAFLNGQSDSLELATFEPKSWEGKSLRIEISAIRALSFECRYYSLRRPLASNKVSCQLQIDRHLTFFDVPIGSEEKGWFFEEPRIRIPSLNQAILDLLKSRGPREHARNALKERSTIDLSYVTYLYCVPGYRPDGPPSPITLV